jgi:hypothetical protein
MYLSARVRRRIHDLRAEEGLGLREEEGLGLRV